MERTNEKYKAYVQILEEELVPAMGCTEPIALAYAAAKAREVLGDLPDSVKIGGNCSIVAAGQYASSVALADNNKFTAEGNSYEYTVTLSDGTCCSCRAHTQNARTDTIPSWHFPLCETSLVIQQIAVTYCPELSCSRSQ